MPEKNGLTVFIEHNPYMSIELLDLIKHYRIVSYNDDATYRSLKNKWDIYSYLNTQFIDEPDSDFVAEILLGNEDFLQKAIPDREHSHVLFFYMNRRMAQLAKQANLKLLLPDYEVQEEVGNKIFLEKICTILNLPSNPSQAFEAVPQDLKKMYEQCKETVGTPFILQDSLGESGWDTALITTYTELLHSIKKIKNGIRVSRYLQDNIPLSVHICILEEEILIRGPWLQLVGLKELSISPFRFTGNDTNQSLLTSEVIQNVRDMTYKIAQLLKGTGYRGILGIDYLWDLQTGIVYPQEINSRLVGLTRLLTGMQKDQSLFPDLLAHVNHFRPQEYTDYALGLRQGEIDLTKRGYSQLIIRNNSPLDVQIAHRLEPGIYQDNGNELIYVKPSLFVHDMEIGEILITSAAHTNCTLTPGEAIVRMILKRSVLADGTYELLPEIVQLIERLKKQTLVSS